MSADTQATETAERPAMEIDRELERACKDDPASGFGFLCVLCFALCVLGVSVLVV